MGTPDSCDPYADAYLAWLHVGRLTEEQYDARLLRSKQLNCFHEWGQWSQLDQVCIKCGEKRCLADIYESYWRLSNSFNAASIAASKRMNC